LELVRVEALDIATMVLVEIGETVVEEDGGLEVDGDVKFDDTLALIGGVAEAGVGDVGVSGRRWVDVVAASLETVSVFV